MLAPFKAFALNIPIRVISRNITNPGDAKSKNIIRYIEKLQ